MDFEIDFDKVSDRLKELREEAGYSHDRLSEELESRGLRIASNSLKKYEKHAYYTDITKNGEIKRELYSAVKGMRIEFLCALADFYGVPTDYILGRTDSKSVDITEQAIFELTGLTPLSIINLKKLNNSRMNEMIPQFRLSSVFDYMLSDNIFVDSFSLHLYTHCRTRIELEGVLQEYKDDPLLRTLSSERYFVIQTVEYFIDKFYDTIKFILETDKKIRKENADAEKDE